MQTAQLAAANGPAAPDTAQGDPTTPPQVSDQTIANLAAQMAPRLEARTSRFDLQLDPAGLGKVKISVSIGPNGSLSAELDFARPESAADLSARSGELQKALAQAGFDLSGGGLTFVTQAAGHDGSTQTGANPSPNAWSTGSQTNGQGFGSGSGQFSGASGESGGRQGRALLTAMAAANDADLAVASWRSQPTSRAVDVRI